MDTLEQFIQSNPDPRELKRAIAVQMSQRGHSYREIRDVLQVSVGFVTSCCQRYKAVGLKGLRLNYWGTLGYLNAQQKQELFDWLAQKDAWTMEEVVDHIEDTYNVIYRSQQSYYALLKQAGFSWKKSQPMHPDKDDERVEEKKLKLWSAWFSGATRSPVGGCESCF